MSFVAYAPIAPSTRLLTASEVQIIQGNQLVVGLPFCVKLKSICTPCRDRSFVGVGLLYGQYGSGTLATRRVSVTCRLPSELVAGSVSGVHTGGDWTSRLA